jgi:hypothetical protein
VSESATEVEWGVARFRHLLLWSWRVTWAASVSGILTEPIATLLSNRYEARTGKRLDPHRFHEMPRMLRAVKAIERDGKAWRVSKPPSDEQFSLIALSLWVGSGLPVEGAQADLRNEFAIAFGLSRAVAHRAILAATEAGEMTAYYQGERMVALIPAYPAETSTPPPPVVEIEDLDLVVARLFMAYTYGYSPGSTRREVLVGNGFSLEAATDLVDCLVFLGRLAPHTDATGAADHIHGDIVLPDHSRIKPEEKTKLKAAWAGAKSDQR